MSLPLKTGFPLGITIKNGYSIRFRAIDPVSGADVAGVNIVNPSVFSDTGEPVTLLPTPVLKYVYQAEDGSQVVPPATAGP